MKRQNGRLSCSKCHMKQQQVATAEAKGRDHTAQTVLRPEHGCYICLSGETFANPPVTGTSSPSVYLHQTDVCLSVCVGHISSPCRPP
jgi:hypothetical protein